MSEILNQVTLGGKPVYEAPPGVYGVNCFSMHTGAGRYGRGAFVMRRSDYNAVLAASPDGTATLNLYSPQGPNGPGQAAALQSGFTADPILQISFAVFVAGADVLSVDVQNVDDLLKVYVFDLRCLVYYWHGSNQRFNVFKPALTYTGSTPDYISSTLNGGNPYSWSDIQTVLEGIFSFSPDFSVPAWTPYNLVFDNLPLVRVVDDIAGRLYAVVGWDWTSAPGTAPINPASVGGFLLVKPGSVTGYNRNLLDKANPYILGGLSSVRNPRRPPNSYAVIFDGAVTNSADPFNDQYVKTVKTAAPDPAAGNGITYPLHAGGMLALGNPPVNQANLDAAAADLASRAYLAATAPFGQQEYAGLWPFFPDGFVRGIQWVVDHRGARTLVRLNNDMDWSPVGQLQYTVETQNNTLVMGLGGTVVGMNSGSSTRYVMGGGAGASIGKGMYQYMVFQMVSQNQSGWDWIRAHQLI